MQMVSITEAQKRFNEIVELAERGEQIALTRYGRTVAVLRRHEPQGEVQPSASA